MIKSCRKCCSVEEVGNRILDTEEGFICEACIEEGDEFDYEALIGSLELADILLKGEEEEE